MEDRQEVDDAIDVAIERTEDAQAEVDRHVKRDLVPPKPVVAKVVWRAEDLDALAHDAAEKEGATDADGEPQRDD
jgi:hypothetical protein